MLVDGAYLFVFTLLQGSFPPSRRSPTSSMPPEHFSIIPYSSIHLAPELFSIVPSSSIYLRMYLFTLPQVST
uniref:Uncharacterized protein n=1 Tax=Aegilops tauschii subsp. strangulata TaxID=200361 RepID=A0A453C524_AEGTS